MQTGLKSYNYGSKRQWRKWVWNRIVERLDISPRVARGFYLLGPDNEDYKIAKQKKFRPANLIGIDMNKKAVISARKQGCIAIQGDISDIICNWGERIDFVNADFCCGLTKQFYRFMGSLMDAKSISDKTVIALNLLRGRDGFSSGVLENAKIGKNEFERKFGRLPKFIEQKMNEKMGNVNKHRGMMAISQIGEFLYYLKRGKFPSGNSITMFYLHYTLMKKMRPDFSWYKSNSGNMIMDSVVFKYPINCEGEYRLDKCMKNKIAAAKAVRTKKILA